MGWLPKKENFANIVLVGLYIEWWWYDDENADFSIGI